MFLWMDCERAVKFPVPVLLSHTRTLTLAFQMPVAFLPDSGAQLAVGMRSGELCVLDSITLEDATGLDKDVAFGRCEQHTTFRRAAILVLRYSSDARWLALVCVHTSLYMCVCAGC